MQRGNVRLGGNVSTANLAQYSNYIRLAALVLLALLAVFTVFKRSQARAARRDLPYGILAVVVVAAMGPVTPVTSWL